MSCDIELQLDDDTPIVLRVYAEPELSIELGAVGPGGPAGATGPQGPQGVAGP